LYKPIGKKGTTEKGTGGTRCVSCILTGPFLQERIVRKTRLHTIRQRTLHSSIASMGDP